MSDKKKPGRFTIQFNLEDPQQLAVSRLLEQQGRRKAQFITSAVLCYTQDREQQVKNDDALEQKILSVIRSHPEILPSSKDDGAVRSEISSPKQPERPWDNSEDNDTMRAIAETLAGFQRGKMTA